MEYESFVYKWINLTNNRVYIGKHKGTPDDGYISSGKSFLTAYENDPSNFIREILWYGSEADAITTEWNFIKEEVALSGWSNLYNKTHWKSVAQWKRICTACGAWCDPSNEEWAAEFELYHFTNCSKSIHAKPKLIEDISKKELLAMCITSFDKTTVIRYYEHLQLPVSSKTKKELSRLRKYILSTILKKPV